MLYHPFLLSGDLTKRQAVELLAKGRNPESIVNNFNSEEGDEDGPVTANIPTRIASRQTSTKQGVRTKSEINMESVNFEAPLMTELRPDTDQPRLGSWSTNNSSQNQNDEVGDLNLALDEALENYDL